MGKVSLLQLQFHHPRNSASVKLSSAHACMSEHAHAHSALAVTLSRPGAPERRPRRCRRRAQRGCRLPHAHRAMATPPTGGTTGWILAEKRRAADPEPPLYVSAVSGALCRRGERDGRITAAQHARGDRCSGRGSRISARFSGRMAPVVRARTPEISAVLVAIPLRDLELLFFSCLPDR